ncbi:hypothetical protein [uncultured Methylobacterium sp.]|uniref:hypothetical protein n=1 Tax=uncultured Methylobacterium sp. TaxID=157278 RepID=UPI0035CB937E
MTGEDDEVVRLSPSPYRWLGVLATSLVFVSIGVVVPSEGTGFWIVNVLGVGFFGLGALVALAQLVPGVSGLTIDRDGFVMKSLGRRHATAWGDVVGAFRVVRAVPAQPMIGYDLTPAKAQGRLARTNKAAYGLHAAIPDTYGRRIEELTALLNARLDRWRSRNT